MNIIYESDCFSEARRQLKRKMDELGKSEIFETVWGIVRDVEDLNTVRHRFSDEAFQIISASQRHYQQEKTQGLGFGEA